MKLKNKNILVYGTGLSGVAAARLLQNIGAVVTIFEENTEDIKRVYISRWVSRIF